MPEITSTPGMVYIVGGGPGDPGLITVKGLQCLHRADVVLYDRLIAQELLTEVSPHTEMIDVGKEPKRHRRSQDEINTLLIEKARQGKIVVRLKGGDPFVFGRGGEECQALAEAGVPFEVVPGVSSAIAVPAYAGIPVTQRGVTTAFTVVAGHTGGSNSTIDWDAISRIGTIVFLMGVEHLPEIVQSLVAHGRPSQTPAALIREGTTRNQLVIAGTLADIVAKTRDIDPPAVFVVGPGTVGLAGGLLGLGLAMLGLWAVRQQPVGYADLAHLDPLMLLATFALAIVASVLAGIVPAWHACQVTPAVQLKSQ